MKLPKKFFFLCTLFSAEAQFLGDKFSRSVRETAKLLPKNEKLPSLPSSLLRLRKGLREEGKGKGKGSSRAIYFARIAQNRRRKGRRKKNKRRRTNPPTSPPPLHSKGRGKEEEEAAAKAGMKYFFPLLPSPLPSFLSLLNIIFSLSRRALQRWLLRWPPDPIFPTVMYACTVRYGWFPFLFPGPMYTVLYLLCLIHKADKTIAL